jgi:molybdopterin molybdotransferase
VLVEVDGDRSVGAGDLVGGRGHPPVRRRHGDDAEGVDVDVEDDGGSVVADGQIEPTDRHRVGERCAGECDVDRSVEVDPMGAVHLTPSPVAVGSEPEVGLVEVSEEEELTNLPEGGESHHVLHVVAVDASARRPALVVPCERQLLVVFPVPARPGRDEPVGRKGPMGCSHGLSLPGATVQPVTPLEEAQTFVLSSCSRAAPIEVEFTETVGMVLAADVVAAELVPPFDNTAVDGYAVLAADTVLAPVELPVVAEVAAGASTDHQLRRGEAIRIMTGAPLPAGSDAVVMVEDTERVGDDRVRISATVAPGAAVRRAGDDVRPGDVLFTAGTVVTPAVVGVLASVNATSLAVHPRARVAVMSTGDELVEDGRPLLPGEIRESNRRMLAAMLRETGCEVADFGTVRDDETALESALRDAAATCDAIVTSGGVSMGDYDVVKAVLGRIADMTWMQIAIKPAKPFAFGKIDGVPIFGLPGNPVSSLVSFEMLARPALRRMMGHRRLARPSVVAVADHAFERHRDGKVHLVRVHAEFGDDGRCHVRSVGAQGSHQLAATALSNAIAIVPDGDGVPDGADVAVVMLTG